MSSLSSDTRENVRNRFDSSGLKLMQAILQENAYENSAAFWILTEAPFWLLHVLLLT